MQLTVNTMHVDRQVLLTANTRVTGTALVRGIWPNAVVQHWLVVMSAGYSRRPSWHRCRETS